MDTPTSAVPDEQTPPKQLGKEKSKPSSPLEIGAARIALLNPDGSVPCTPETCTSRGASRGC